MKSDRDRLRDMLSDTELLAYAAMGPIGTSGLSRLQAVRAKRLSDPIRRERVTDPDGERAARQAFMERVEARKREEAMAAVETCMRSRRHKTMLGASVAAHHMRKRDRTLSLVPHRCERCGGFHVRVA